MMSSFTGDNGLGSSSSFNSSKPDYFYLFEVLLLAEDFTAEAGLSYFYSFDFLVEDFAVDFLALYFTGLDTLSSSKTGASCSS